MTFSIVNNADQILPETYATIPDAERGIADRLHKELPFARMFAEGPGYRVIETPSPEPVALGPEEPIGFSVDQS
jgi:hypothetical protein